MYAFCMQMCPCLNQALAGKNSLSLDHVTPEWWSDQLYFLLVVMLTSHIWSYWNKLSCNALVYYQPISIYHTVYVRRFDLKMIWTRTVNNLHIEIWNYWYVPLKFNNFQGVHFLLDTQVSSKPIIVKTCALPHVLSLTHQQHLAGQNAPTTLSWRKLES